MEHLYLNKIKSYESSPIIVKIFSDKEIEMIKQALIRTKGRRKLASKELGISERTLYRKIKQHKLGDINEL